MRTLLLTITLLLSLTVVDGIPSALNDAKDKSFTLQKIENIIAKEFDSWQSYTLPDNPTLIDYERALLVRNPAIRTAFARWRASVAKIAVSKGLPDPQINFGYFLQNVETAVGPQQYKIGISQMVPWFGKLTLQGDIQAREADAEFQRLHDLINEQLYMLKATYYDYYFLMRSIAITRAHIELVTAWENVMRYKYASNSTAHMDLIKAQIETIKLTDDLNALEAKAEPLLEAFRNLLDDESIIRIILSDSLQFEIDLPDKIDAQEFIHAHNPDIMGSLTQQEISEEAVRRAKMNFIPDMMLGIDYILTGDKWSANGMLVPESGKDPLILMASITFPLWWNKINAQVKAAQLHMQSARANSLAVINAVDLELENIWRELTEARRRIVLYRDQLIPKSIESLKASEKAYTSNQTEFLTLIDAQRRYLEFLLAYELSQINYLKAFARLEKISGRQ